VDVSLRGVSLVSDPSEVLDGGLISKIAIATLLESEFWAKQSYFTIVDFRKCSISRQHCLLAWIMTLYHSLNSYIHLQLLWHWERGKEDLKDETLGPSAVSSAGMVNEVGRPPLPPVLTSLGLASCMESCTAQTPIAERVGYITGLDLNALILENLAIFITLVKVPWLLAPCLPEPTQEFSIWDPQSSLEFFFQNRLSSNICISSAGECCHKQRAKRLNCACR
jgi:hypothetical protein